jgi:hypothetical protein
MYPILSWVTTAFKNVLLEIPKYFGIPSTVNEYNIFVVFRFEYKFKFS